MQGAIWRPASNFIRPIANIAGPLVRRAMRYMIAAQYYTGTRGPPLRHDPPAAPAVRDELERILSSETFKRSERARELLSYLVGREQLGEAERLKGYAIAVDVFGKDFEFNSSTDAVVRVQAGRLRELLSQYYAAEGRSDPIRMVIPRGSYVPAYEDMPEGGTTQLSPEALANHAPAPAEANAAANSRPAGPNKPPSPKLGVGAGQVRLLWGALAFVALLLVAVAYHISVPGGTAATNTAVAQETAMQTGAIPEPSPEALPTVRVVAESDDAELSASLPSSRRPFQVTTRWISSTAVLPISNRLARIP